MSRPRTTPSTGTSSARAATSPRTCRGSSACVPRTALRPVPLELGAAHPGLEWFQPTFTIGGSSAAPGERDTTAGAVNAASLQERWAPRNRCFGCGPANERGLRDRSFPEGDEVVCSWTPEPHHEAFDGFLNGGIIGALFDCHCNWTALHHLITTRAAHRAPCTVTAEFHVILRRPTPSAIGSCFGRRSWRKVPIGRSWRGRCSRGQGHRDLPGDLRGGEGRASGVSPVGAVANGSRRF